MSNSADDWEYDFEKELKIKGVLQKLMYDRQNNEQKELLLRIAQEKSDVKLWLQYIEYTVKHGSNSTKQNQLLRMCVYCLSILSPLENQLKDNRHFLEIHLLLLSLKRNADALKYFETVIARADKSKKSFDVIIGKSYENMYRKWCETILKVTEEKIDSRPLLYDQKKERAVGLEYSIRVLRMGIENKVQPNGFIKNQMQTFFVELQKLKEELQSMKNDDMTSTIAPKNRETVVSLKEVDIQSKPVVVVEKRATRSSALEAKGESVVTVAKAAPSGLSGKCVRVSKSSVKDSDESNSPFVESSLSASSSGHVKPSLSSYVDENLKNFNPVWKPKDSTKVVSTSADAPAVVSSETVVSGTNIQSKVAFSVVDTNIDVPSSAMHMSLSSTSATSSRVATPAAPRRPLAEIQNTDVSDVRQNKKPKLTNSKECLSDVEEEGETATNDSDRSEHNFNMITIALTNKECCEMSVLVDSDTVKVSGGECSMEVDTEEVKEINYELPTVVPSTPAVLASVPTTPALSKIARSYTEPTPSSKPVVSSESEEVAPSSSSPLLLSALAAPISVKQKKRGRVSFAHNDDLALIESMEAARMVESTPRNINNNNGQKSAVGTPSRLTSNEKNIIDDPKNLILVNNREYIQLGAIGKGGSGVVTSIVSKETGEIFAFKKITIPGNMEPDVIEEQIEDQMKEISLLQQLNGSPLIVELFDFEVKRDSLTVCMILEKGEIALDKVLISHQKQDVTTGINEAASTKGLSKSAAAAMMMSKSLDPFFGRMIWKQMLDCVQYIHSKNIIHGDLKPANFVFVKGHLKLIDFGIASTINNDTTNVYLESQRGTLNYMSPESLLPIDSPSSTKGCETGDENNNQNERSRTMRLGRSSDVWSLGCILYQMMYGRPPFAAFSIMHHKIGVITNEKHVIDYPTVNKSGVLVDVSAIESIKGCLVYDRNLRKTIGGSAGLLNMSYLTMVHGNNSISSQSAATDVSSIASSDISTSKEESIQVSQVQSMIDVILKNVSNQLTSTSNTDAQQLLCILNSMDKSSLVNNVMNDFKFNRKQNGITRSASLDISSESTNQMVTKTTNINQNNLTSLSVSVLNSSSSSGEGGSTSSNSNSNGTRDLTRYPSTPSGKIATAPHHNVAGGGLASAAKVKKLFASVSKASLSSLNVVDIPKIDSLLAGSSKVSFQSLPQPVSALKKSREPLKTLPLTLQNQIQLQMTKLSSVSESGASKWVKPVSAAPANDMKSVMEERLGQMRKIMNLDQDIDVTVTDTMNNTFNFDQF